MEIKQSLFKTRFILAGIVLAILLRVLNVYAPELHFGWAIVLGFSVAIQYLVNQLSITRLKIESFKDLIFCPRCKKVEKDGMKMELEKVISDNIIDMHMKVCDKCAVYYSRVESPANEFIGNLKTFIDLVVKEKEKK